MAIGRESFFWHKLHSLTGIIPVGLYMIQHLTLNSFSFAGPEKFDGVIGFFQSIPGHILWVLEIFLILIPLLFHGIYGLFITSRGSMNISDKAYRWRENWMYTWQRITGIGVFLFIIYHIITTTVAAKVSGEHVIEWQAWHDKLTGTGYLWLIVYAVGVLMASYHLCYGLWNFCIRWGITVSDRAQRGMQKFSAGAFVVVTLLGWLALVGFLKQPPISEGGTTQVSAGQVELTGVR